MYKKISMVLIGLVCTSMVLGGSIYAKRNSQMKSLYADDTARGVGDILTIIIAEDHKTDNKVSRELQNETTRSSDFNGNIGLGDTEQIDILGFTMGATASRDLEGQSDYSDERSVEDRLTVVVEDVLENGNLVVIGTRERNIAGDKQTISVSGIVRPSDISFANTVKSDQVANFTLITINDGVTDKYNEPGWLSKVFDAIWPL